jgi:hypothetical protein
MAKKKPLFKIVPNSIVKGDSIGHLVCETIPVHRDALILPDRKKRYISLARVIVENNLGYITDASKTEIHHVDENPENNELSNLKLRTKEDHARGHSHEKKFWKKSPRTKPGQHRKAALRVVDNFINTSVM